MKKVGKMNRIEYRIMQNGDINEVLFVLCSNASAQEFYEHIGWREESIVKTYTKILNQ